MFPHAMIGSNDLEKARAFYDATIVSTNISAGGKTGLEPPVRRSSISYFRNDGV